MTLGQGYGPLDTSSMVDLRFWRTSLNRAKGVHTNEECSQCSVERSFQCYRHSGCISIKNDPSSALVQRGIQLSNGIGTQSGLATYRQSRRSEVRK